MSKHTSTKQAKDIIDILFDNDDTRPLDGATMLMELTVSILETAVNDEADFESDELLFSAEGERFKLALTVK